MVSIIHMLAALDQFCSTLHWHLYWDHRMYFLLLVMGTGFR
jgi:hypothetical protein